MDKRRRISTANHLDEDMDDNSSEQSASISTRKRKRLDPAEMCQQLYDSIRNYKKEDGTMLCDTFIRAPKRRQEPSYYDVVDNPIDLLRVQQKLKTDSYEDVEELTSDLDLLVKNSKAFYKADSTEYEDACLLWEIYNSNKTKLLESNVGDDEPSTKVKKIGRPRKSANYMDNDDASETSSRATDDDIEYYEELFNSIVTATDDNNRRLYTMFQFLPSKKQYPDYYEIIEHPIDLKFIATKIQTNAYISLSEIEKDVLQMTKNACTFNEPGSQIYKDAKTLKKIFLTKKQEIETGKFKPKEKKKRGQSLSAAMAAMKEPVEDSDDENGDADDFEADGPFWQLFDHLYNSASATDNTNAPGVPLGESLWKLPNRRFHPEYYSTITKPISMAQIRNKLKKNEYSNITDLTADLYLMIDNAKKAYPPTHKTHKDAVKMLKILNQKLVDVKVEEESDDDEETTSSSTSGKKKGRPKLTSTSPVATVPTPTSSTTVSPVIVSGTSPKTTKFPNNPLLKKKLLGLQKFLSEYTLNGRRLMALFMEKPSKKLYPDYYDIIQHPIDMNTIEHNIKADKYGTLDDVVGDFRLMFANCRKYNEEGSMIYEDANILERALNEKLKEFSGINDRRLIPKVIKGGRKTVSPMDAKLRQLYDVIRDYRDPKTSRQLALIFMKLPSKSDYPDYYDIIKNPIDMEKIAHKLKQQFYDNVEEIATDFMLMFENACKYNEPDSQIYKDALVLQQLCIKTKQSLRDDDTVPDVSQAVQELLLSLFTTFYNHQDEEGRCFSDSLAELDEYDTIDGNKVRAISLDLIKRRLDKGLYKRLDIFQEDVFQCLDRARRLSRTDSQIFEDSIELQSFFIKKRDELCKDVLTSPALSYTAMHLSASVEAVRQTKLLQEEQEQEQDNDITSTQGESMTIDQKVYSPGDFVYYEVPDHKLPRVIYIERLWSNDGLKMMYGNVFLRPFETFHVTTRKFLEQELFKSDQHEAIPLDKLVGKCCVLSIKDYFKYKPEGFADKDIYVCESRYSTKLRAFKKIKNWPFANKTALKLREVPLEAKRVMSVFKERVEKHKGELAELQLQEALVEKEKPNILALNVSNNDDGNNYYEQYNTVGSGVVRTGDFVYVATESGKQSIAQIHTIWDSKDGKSYFRGPWFLMPPEVPGTANRFFYRQELMQSTSVDTSPIIAIVGRCSVLDFRDYTLLRSTEIPESDVYICESTYDELKKHIRKHIQGMGIRKFQHSQMVTPDEIYHFKSPVVPVRVSTSEIAALEHIKGTNMGDSDVKAEGTEIYGIMEDSMDGGPPSVGSDMVATASPAPSAHVATPVSTKRTKGKGKLVTGYILYSSEVRKDRAQNNPDCTFGDISRMVGNEWRNMTAAEKFYWEEKAAKSNEENAIKYAEEHGCPSPAPVHSIFSAEPVLNQIFECGWDKCDWQFEDPLDCLDHCVTDGTGHIQTYYNNLQSQGNEIEYNCLWRGCIRQKKNAPPFPHLQRLIKHVREVHINKGGRIVLPADRSTNFMPSKKIQQQQQQNQQQQQMQTQQAINQNQTQNNISNTIGTSQQINQPAQQPSQVVQIMAAPPAEPLFVTVPPRPQRVLHSEAYIKYIEGLQNDSRFITPWEKTLHTTRETAPAVDTSKLPIHWLGPKSKEKSEDSINMLWKLRNYMMKDVLQIPRPGYY